MTTNVFFSEFKNHNSKTTEVKLKINHVQLSDFNNSKADLKLVSY
jgi:hypothetical protein